MGDWGVCGSGTRRRSNFCLRKDISFTKAASLILRWSSSDLNSWRMAEITAIGEAFVFLLVAIVEPPREVSSGIDTISTGGGGAGGCTDRVERQCLERRRERVPLDLEDLVEAEVLEVVTDLGGRVGMEVSVSWGVMKTSL